MEFVSFEFIGFIAAVFLLYFTLPRKAQWPFLLLASYVFYISWDVGFMIFILATTVSSYIVSRRMGSISVKHREFIELHREEYTKDERKAMKAASKKQRLRWLSVGLVFNFGMLAVLKYTAFTLTNINSVISIFSPSEASSLPVPNILLPLGISFYIFQTMSYLIDVYREKCEPEKNPFKLALFVSFFPQLIQGPISRFGDLAPQLFAEHKPEWDNFRRGMQRILWGFFKKMVIADRILVAIATIIKGTADNTGAIVKEYTGMYVIAAIFFYSIRIYADFTGGIDITIGIAKVLGINVAENFRHPFFSKSTKEYWNRWHITMGTWFTDYIFYPLSVSKPMLKLSKTSREKLGNNIGKRVPVYLATIVTWFTTGLWHGAAWNFIVWGLLNCLIILIEQKFTPFREKFSKKFPRFTGSGFYAGFLMFQTFWLMGIIRILDCYANVLRTFRMYGTVFTTANWGDLFNGAMLKLGLSASDYLILFAGCIIMLTVSIIDVRKPILDRLDKKPGLSFVLFSALIVAILLFGAYGIGYDASQFIYTVF